MQLSGRNSTAVSIGHRSRETTSLVGEPKSNIAMTPEGKEKFSCFARFAGMPQLKSFNRRIIAAVLFLGLLMIPLNTARADETSPPRSVPKSALEILQDLTRARDNYGVLIEPENPDSLSRVTRMVPTRGTDIDTSTSSLCADLSETSCPRSDGGAIVANLVLGKCENDSDIGCIEGMQISLAGGELTDLTFVEYVVKNLPSIPQSSEFNTPRGEFPSLWRSQAGEFYLVKFLTGFSFSMKNGKLEKGGITTELSVSRIQIVTGTYQLPFIRPTPRIEDPSRDTISWSTGSNSTCGSRNFANLTTCYQSIPFEARTRIKATVRMPKSASGWMNGRITNPTISSSATSNGQMQYKIEGDVAPTLIAGGVVPATAPSDLLSQQLRNLPLGSITSRDPAGSISLFNALDQYIGDRALTTQNLWIVKSSSSINPKYMGATGSDNCMNQITGFVGIVSTNAAVYDASPPTWDSVNGILSYNVGSPHFDENGIEAVGNYSLAIPPLVAQCLYGDSALPASVPIEVGYTDAATPITQRVTITRDENWIRFSATGFHFSSPRIKVKLGFGSKSKVRITSKLRTQSLTSLASVAKLKVAKGAKLTGSVSEVSKATCSLSKRNILTRKKKGLCQVVLSSTKGKTINRKVVLISFK
jgi:hypothetical protein